jgi:hypothetical protein
MASTTSLTAAKFCVAKPLTAVEVAIIMEWPEVVEKG